MSAGSGYFISPPDEPGPGVMLLHSFRGLDRWAKDTANALADAGFTTFAPDLFVGEIYDDDAVALAALQEMDMNVMANLVQASVGVLRRAAKDPDASIGIVGYGPGASLAVWLSARLPDEVSAVVTYYGAQSIAMDASQAAYLCHWAEADPLVSDLEVAELGLSLQMADRKFRFEHHDGTRTGFAQSGHPNHDPEADVVAWRQTTEFLASNLDR